MNTFYCYVHEKQEVGLREKYHLNFERIYYMLKVIFGMTAISVRDFQERVIEKQKTETKEMERRK
jgi:hypothetical protein